MNAFISVLINKDKEETLAYYLNSCEQKNEKEITEYTKNHIENLDKALKEGGVHDEYSREESRKKKNLEKIDISWEMLILKVFKESMIFSHIKIYIK